MTTITKEQAAIAATYNKAERLAAATRHAAAMAKDQNVSLNQAAIAAENALVIARKAYWEAGF